MWPWLRVVSASLLLASTGNGSLPLYDAAISADEAGAGPSPVARLLSPLTFTGSNNSAFDFGPTSGAVTIEFIVEGDPVAGGGDGFLAVGSNSGDSLRYEQWHDTGQLGFTRGGVADYLFSPLVLSPTEPTHVTYVWDGVAHMDLYLDGSQAGRNSSTGGAFTLPTGNGYLGAKGNGAEGMVGTIHRVTVYDEALEAATILRHADAYNGVTYPPGIDHFSASPEAYLAPGNSTLTWNVSDADTLSINGTDVTALPHLVVSPTATTVYTLTATNGDGSTVRDLTVTVDPAPIISSFTADRGTINAGESAILMWQTDFATDWSIAPSPPGNVSGVTADGDGMIAVSPAVTTNYTLTASSPHGFATRELSVRVAIVATHPVIGEFMADNETTLADGDGDFSDWIEIHNPTASDLDLEGYFLTDDPADLTKWAFPSAPLDSGERLIVFASSKHPSGPAGELHANFRLSKDGEFLALVAPDGSSVLHAFSPAFGVQSNDVSYGIFGGDLSTEQYMGIPTPGTANDATPPAPDPVSFSLASQTFTGSLDVDLSSATGAAEIYYTTDGSEPSSANGTTYTGSIIVNSTTHLRAIAEFGDQSSPISGETFIRLASDLANYETDIPLMVIDNFGAGTVPAKGWNSTGSGVQQVARQSAVWATFDRDPDTGMARLTDAPQMVSRAGIRGRGAYSSSWAQKPYSVEVWDEAANERDVEVLGMPEHSDWILYYPDTDTNKDPSMMFNTFMYELSNNIGRYASRIRWVEAFVNEDGGDLSLADRRGVYAIFEKVSRGDERLDFEKLSEDGTSGGWLLGLNRMDSIPVGGFPAANGVSQPQFFHTKGPNRISQTAPNSSGSGDDIPRQSNGFLNFDNPGGYKMNPAQRDSIEAWFATFEDVLYDDAQWLDPVDGYHNYLDAQDFVEYFIFNNLSRNGDGMLISMFPWKGDDGKLRMGPAWDYNWSSYYVGGGPTGTFRHRADRLWYGRLFNDPDFEQLYVDRWFHHRDHGMSNAAMSAIIDGQAAEIGLERAIRQGFDDEDDWTSELTTFKNWLTSRADWYDDQFTDRPDFDLKGGEVTEGFLATFAPHAGTIYFTTNGDDPRASGGGIATGAQQYSSGFEVTESVLMTARAKVREDWSAPVEAYFFVDTVPASITNLVTSQIHYRPADASPSEIAAGFTDRDDFEFIELLNSGPQSLNLTDVRFIEGISFDFSSSILRTLDPGARVLLVNDLEAFTLRYGNGFDAIIAGEYGGNLSNDGETLSLVDAGGGSIRSFSYNDRNPWPEEADQNGYSLVLIAPGQNPPPTHGDPFLWRASLAVDGVPGSSDSTSYPEWKLANGVPTPETDPDMDGDSRYNLLEYVEGTPPQVPDEGNGWSFGIEPVNVSGSVDDYQVLRYERVLGTDDVIISAELTDDFAIWESQAGVVEFVGRNRVSASTEVLIFRSAVPAAGQAKKFGRIKVELR